MLLDMAQFRVFKLVIAAVGCSHAERRRRVPERPIPGGVLSADVATKQAAVMQGRDAEAFAFPLRVGNVAIELCKRARTDRVNKEFKS